MDENVYYLPQDGLVEFFPNFYNPVGMGDPAVELTPLINQTLQKDTSYVVLGKILVFN